MKLGTMVMVAALWGVTACGDAAGSAEDPCAQLFGGLFCTGRRGPVAGGGGGIGGGGAVGAAPSDRGAALPGGVAGSLGAASSVVGGSEGIGGGGGAGGSSPQSENNAMNPGVPSENYPVACPDYMAETCDTCEWYSAANRIRCKEQRPASPRAPVSGFY